MQDYLKFAAYYIRIKNPNANELCVELKAQTSRLNEWEVDVSYPFLLTMMDKHSSGEVATHVLILIESFVVRRRVPTNRLRRIFAGLIGQLQVSNVVASCRNFLLKNQWPDDTEFNERLLDYRLYNRTRLSRTRLILRSLESSFDHKESPGWNDDTTIEHIMPQKLTDSWNEMIGPDANQAHERWLDTVGNLTLTAYNPELGNDPFHAKKEIYRSSNYALTSDSVEGASIAIGMRHLSLTVEHY